ncbi:energy transducer TonB [uncultured Neptuniibacter sp.]|uniref:energy transducer TonB n=1 Tax=uncultured Neptuniibacter sp. TaxID=502143 RepID=UPI00261081F9|nr:energy transducer TonB [uncultured Neptuniibacter sp.]
MTTVTTQAVSAIERFGFTLFFATALHAVAIIGISFTAETTKPPQQTIEVTLAQFQQEKKPKEADFIAQANQEGSGSSEEKKLPSTPQRANFHDEKRKRLAPSQTRAITNSQQPTPLTSAEAKPNNKPAPEAKAKTAKRQVVTTQKVAQQKAPDKIQKKREKTATSSKTGNTSSLLSRSLEIASLQAELDSHREMMAKKPRVKRLTSASTQKREDALYLENWRKKIENVGNLNYPEEARRNKLYGRLRLLVAIKPDGAVHSIEVLESSGQTVLDDAAIRIVRLAAPFQPFPVEIRKNTDILEIIRTWKFEKKASVY